LHYNDRRTPNRPLHRVGVIPGMPLKIIGAGLPRTGTRSLQIALDHLGFGPCHHMYELLEDSSQWPAWMRIYNGEGADWEEVFRGYTSAVDAPAAFSLA